MRSLPIYARIDGRSFSKFTRDMDRPFDNKMTCAMIETVKYLVDKSGATLGYTQSDEISLVWANTDHTAELWFGGKIHKITSVLASMATIAFVEGVMTYFPDWQLYLHRMPHFDCRVMQVPNLDELANCLLWRNLDCMKNSVSQAAAAHYAANELMNKNTQAKIDMLEARGIRYEDYPDSFKLGTFVRKRTTLGQFDPQKWASIPIAHRPPLSAEIYRSEICAYHLPKLNTVKNRKEVLFGDADVQLNDTV